MTGPLGAAGADRGAWGIRWRGLDPVPAVLGEAPGSWPEVTVDVQVDRAHGDPVPLVWEPGEAQFALKAGGALRVHQATSRVELTLPAAVPTECAIQPHLAAAAASFGLWRGAGVLHGGAFVHGGRAWAVVGNKGAGKSTTMALLAGAGLTVLSDDLVVVQDGAMLAGPRCVDLRADVAEHLGVGRDLGVIGTRPRWRVDLGPAPPEAPFGGLIKLEWGESVAVRPLTVAERLALVLQSGALPIPATASPAALDLAGAAGLVWARPSRWAAAETALDQLLERLPQ